MFQDGLNGWEMIYCTYFLMPWFTNTHVYNTERVVARLPSEAPSSRHVACTFEAMGRSDHNDNDNNNDNNLHGLRPRGGGPGYWTRPAGRQCCAACKYSTGRISCSHPRILRVGL